MRAALLLLAVLVALPRGGVAAPPARVVREAQARFERANRLYNEGRYTDALLLYQAAYDLIPSPDFLFNLALAREKTLDFEGCAQALRQYLRDPQSDADRERARARLESCRSRTLIPVKVSSLPPSAAVYVGTGKDKVLRGRTPTRLDLPPGTYLVTVETPGYQRMSQMVVTDIGQRPDLDFSLERLSSLRIEADVAGAHVHVNQGPAEPAPLYREVAAGLYQVRVTKSGHQDVDRKIRVEPGQQVALMLSLPSLPRTMTLVSSVPAMVRLDGRSLGQTPLKHAVGAGNHRLEVEEAAHVPLVTDFVMSDDRDVTLRAELRQRPSRWHLVVAAGLLGTAAACLVAGSTYGIMALVDEHHYKTGVPTMSLRDQGERHARLADGLLIAAAGTAAAAVVYYLVVRSRHSRLATRP